MAPRKRLLNTFFFLDPNLEQLTGRTAALYSCRRNLALVHILLINGAVETALGEALQIQNMALRFGFPDLVVSSALIIREIYAGQNDEKNFYKQDKLVEEYEAACQPEQLSEKYIQFICLAYQSGEALRQTTLLEINTRCDELLQLSEQHTAPLINFNAFEAWMLRFEWEGDFASAADVAEQAEDYLKKQPTHQDDEKLKLFALGRLRAAIKPNYTNRPKIDGLSPFDDYNQRGDILSVLLSEGWTLVKENSKNYFLKRSGNTTSPHSATLHKQTNVLYVFSTSTEFEAEKRYAPATVYGILKHNRDFSACAKDLLDKGYGERITSLKPPQNAKKEVSKIKVDDADFSFLANKAKIHQYISNGS